MKKLLVLLMPYELFDTHNFFQADFKKTELKGISYGRVQEDNFENTKGIDVLFIPKKNYKDSFEPVIQDIFSHKKEIFLLVQKENSQREYLIETIHELSGNRLQYPVRDIDMEDEKELFSFLSILSSHHLKKYKNEYQTSFKQYLDGFNFDYETEAKLQFLNTCKNQCLEELLKNEKNQEIIGIINKLIATPSIKKELELLKNLEDKNFEILFDLQKLIFPPEKKENTAK